MENRRTFIKKTALASTAISMPAFYACDNESKNNAPKISLAQWSLHRAFNEGTLDPKKFSTIAKKDYGISAVEYVNAFYSGLGEHTKFWNEMKTRANDEGVKSLLIMVDDEGFLGDSDTFERKKTIENHYKWIHAAKILGCHSVRVNAFGKGTRTKIREALLEGLGELSAYGQKEDINILIENHGLHTSDAEFIIGIIKEINNPYLGTLPDFGNWCLTSEWGSTQNNTCDEVYDRYQGTAEFLPFAKGVSAKSYAFDAIGNETSIDYRILLQQVKDSGFEGYIGVEFEGENMKEPEGIQATKALIEKVWASLG
jgi:sugar phosphate isomerase/epimerase